MKGEAYIHDNEKNSRTQELKNSRTQGIKIEGLALWELYYFGAGEEIFAFVLLGDGKDGLIGFQVD